MNVEAASLFLKATAPFLGPIIAAMGLAFGFYQWRKTHLRRDDVLKWSNEAISVLETFYLICLLRTSDFNQNALDERLVDTVFDTAILVEKGRMFFKNTHPTRYGTKKNSAYRGYRPMILDPLVVAHKIARALPSADEERRLRITLVAEDALKKFVSLAQKEVGRDRTAAADTRRGGDGQHLKDLLAAVAEDRVAKLRAGNMPSRG